MAAKKLTVNLDYNQPSFEFEGPWAGKDVRVVLANIRRAYLRHVKALRAQASVEADESVVTKRRSK